MDLLVRFTNYLNSPQNNLSKKTVKNYRADLNSFFSWYKKQYNLQTNSTSTMAASQIVESYKESIIKESRLSAVSLKRHMSTLRKFFQFLKAESIISEDPFEQMKISNANSLALKDKWHLLAFKNYLYLQNKSPLTIKNYILDARHFLAWVEQLTKEDVLSQISVSMVNVYKIRLLDLQFSPRTINRKLSSIRKYINWATVEGFIQNSELEPKLSETLESPPMFNLEKLQYSRFPPLRVIQKTLKGIGFLFDLSLIFPLDKLTRLSIPHVSSIPKRFYAPLSISIRYVPFAILFLFTSFLSVAIYQFTTQSPQNQKSVLGTLQTDSPRILTFSGRLQDNYNNAMVVSETPVRMSIYNDEIATGSSLLWQEVVEINTDPQGKFSAILGDNTSLSQNLFAQNQALWLGVSVGNEPELTPRQPLAGVSLAANAQKLQGLNLITNPNHDTKNVVLALDSSGNLTIDGDSEPTFQATGGKFKLMGETLILSTTPGSNTNVEIAPMDLGKIDLQKPIFNSTENSNMENAIGAVEINDSLAILATSSATSAFTINQTATGQLISAYTGSAAKFAVDNNGNIISQSGNKWQPFSDSTSALNIANATGNTFVTFDSTNARVGIGTTGPAYALHVNGSNAEIAISSGQNDNVFARWLQNTTERGAIFYQNSDSTFHVRSASGLAFDTDNSNIPKVYIATSGNVGIGTTTPFLKLDVQDEKAASAAAQIFNTAIGTDSAGLIIKLGNTSPIAVENTNHFINFETAGIGIVGSVRGSGAAGVDFKTSGIADFAEYLKKDENQDIEYGSLVCIDDLGLVLPCDQNNNKIVGIASNHGGFTGGVDLGKSSIRVGFVGQVYTKVSTINGNIKPGDSLTFSSIPGVAVKATSAGTIVGKAMEALNPNASECVSPNISEFGSIRTNHSDQFVCTGRVLVVLSVSWYDPSIYISTTGNILTPNTENPKTSSIVSPIPEINEIHTDIVSPLPVKPIATILNDSSETKTSTPAALLSNETETHKASSESASQNIEQLSIISPYPAPLASIERQNTNTDLFAQELISFGPTSLADTSITGHLSIGSLVLQDNSINTFGAVLELQPLRQGNLSIMGGLVYIDTNGDLKVDGNAQIAKNLTVGGDVIASGSGTFNKLNLSIAKNAFAISSKELTATGSAGTAYVRAREAEITINNKLVTDKSLIYITPAGTPSGQTPFLLRQAPDKSFTVGIASSSATNTPFNWLIIN